MTASTLRLPPHGHRHTSAPKVLRCKLAQSNRGRLRCGSSMHPAPLLGGKGAATFCDPRTTFGRSFAFGAKTPWKRVSDAPITHLRQLSRFE
jgi:hypothetical protein